MSYLSSGIHIFSFSWPLLKPALLVLSAQLKLAGKHFFHHIHALLHPDAIPEDADAICNIVLPQSRFILAVESQRFHLQACSCSLSSHHAAVEAQVAAECEPLLPGEQLESPEALAVVLFQACQFWFP
ncbi:hypothetical protein Pelo_19941 [Pelomyxa schiedti]|nr:hypothetical protein Pelo_19941 [Pelomyxa schiedti]